MFYFLKKCLFLLKSFTKPIWKHCNKIQIFVWLWEPNLALRAQNSEQPSRCHFSIQLPSEDIVNWKIVWAKLAVNNSIILSTLKACSLHLSCKLPCFTRDKIDNHQSHIIDPFPKKQICDLSRSFCKLEN